MGLVEVTSASCRKRDLRRECHGLRDCEGANCARACFACFWRSIGRICETPEDLP